MTIPFALQIAHGAEEHPLFRAAREWGAPTVAALALFAAAFIWQGRAAKAGSAPYPRTNAPPS